MKIKEYNPVFNSYFKDDLYTFLSGKRAIGYCYESEAHILSRIDRYFSERTISKITEETISEWVTKRSEESDRTFGARVGVLRQFCLFLNRTQTVCIIPAPPKKSGFSKSFTPYIFTHSQINQILLSADSMPIHRNGKNIKAVMPVLLRLLYCCGLRINEALSLQMKHIDFKRQTITVLHAKNDDCRLIPISKSLCDYLENYANQMYVVASEDDFLFPSPRQEQYDSGTIYSAFREILWRSGISHGGRGNGPRLHDLRHTFAVHTLQKLVQDGKDSYLILPILSTYLGHKNIHATEKYLRLTSEMYPDILDKVEKRLGKLIPEVACYDEY